MTLITTNEKRPMFADLGELATAITGAIKNALASGVEVTDVHVHPKMREIMDQLNGSPVLNIGSEEHGWHDIVSDSTCPIDQFRLIRKYPQEKTKP